MGPSPYIPRDFAASLIAICGLLVLFVGGTVLLMVHLMDFPRVIQSQYTGLCLSVDAPGHPEYSCTHLPPRYDVVWVRR